MATPPTRVSYNAPASGNYSTATSPKTTASFDVQVGDVVVVLCSVENAGNQSVVTPSASGGSVTWTQRVRQPATNNGSTSAAWCWTGAVGATATGITVSLARPTTDTTLWWGMSATVYRAHGGVGVVFSGTNGTGANSAPSVAATCSANSAVVCVVNDWNAADGTTRTWRTINGAAETETFYFRDAAHHTAYGGYRADTGAAGSITQGLTAPTGQRWVLAGVEILGTTSGTQYPASGATASTSAAAGSAGLRALATSAVTAISVAVGSPTSALPTTGAAVAVSTAIGTPTALLPSSGSAASVSAAASDAVTSLLPITGTTVATSAAAGSAEIQGATQTYPASGTATAVSAATGAITLLGAMSAATPASSTATGAVTSLLAATAVASSTSGTSGSADLQPGGALAAQGTGVSTSTASGVIQLRAAANGAAACSSTVVGTAAAHLITTGAASAASAISGDLAARVVVVGAASSTTTTSGDVFVYDPSIPPLPTAGVSLTVSVAAREIQLSTDARGLTATVEARDLEVTT